MSNVEEHYELIIKIMGEKIEDLQKKYDYEQTLTNFYRGYCQELEDRVSAMKPKRGRPAKKRGRGKPKGAK